MKLTFLGAADTGTGSRHLVDAAREGKIHGHGECLAAKAEVSHLDGFSGHVDADELMDGLRGLESPPEHRATLAL